MPDRIDGDICASAGDNSMLLLLDDLAEVYMYDYVQFLLCKYADEGHDFEQIWLQNRRKMQIFHNTKSSRKIQNIDRFIVYLENYSC